MNADNLQVGGSISGDPIPMSAKPRIDYVDLMKGLTILWIIWIHTYHPDFGNYRNPLFFFASGIFFKFSNAKTFFTKRLWMIIIPFCFFYLMSIPFRYLLDLWDYKDFSAFDWNRLFDIFYIKSEWDYLSLNVPLWFLLTLFWIQTFSLIIFRLPKWGILILALLSLIFKEELTYYVPTPLMINNALAWFGFFAIGYLIGKPIIGYLNSMKRKTYIFSVTLLIVIGCIALENFEVADWHGIMGNMKLIVFIVCFMTFFSFFNGWKKLEVLRFFGKNSLIVLGAHLWILIPLTRFLFKLTRSHDPWLGLICAIVCAVILIPIINWMNRAIPILVGKKNLDSSESLTENGTIKSI